MSDRSSEFAQKLHQLCRVEGARVMGNGDAAASMVTELAIAMTDAIAITQMGQVGPCRQLAGLMAAAIPQMVFQKSALVRATVEEEAGRA